MLTKKSHSVRRAECRALRRAVCLGSLLIASTAMVAVVPAEVRAEGAPTSRPARVRPIRFVPNVDSAPSNLGTATSRGRANDPYLAASVVAPQEKEGLTTQESPALFWYTTKPTNDKIEVVLVKADDLADVKPLVKVVFRDPLTSGLQRLDLKKAGVKLEAGVRYKWSVSIVDSEGRSGDLISQAIIRRVALSEKLSTGLAQTQDPSEQVNLYAESGIWYDMLSVLSNAIDADPGNTVLRQQRANVLEQVGLPLVPKELKNWAAGPGAK